MSQIEKEKARSRIARDQNRNQNSQNVKSVVDKSLGSSTAQKKIETPGWGLKRSVRQYRAVWNRLQGPQGTSQPRQGRDRMSSVSVTGSCSRWLGWGGCWGSTGTCRTEDRIGVPPSRPRCPNGCVSKIQTTPLPEPFSGLACPSKKFKLQPNYYPRHTSASGPLGYPPLPAAPAKHGGVGVQKYIPCSQKLSTENTANNRCSLEGFSQRRRRR